MNSKVLMVVAALAMSLSAGGARAATVSFTISGPFDPTTTFELPQSPTPDVVETHLFQILDIPVITNGTPGTDSYNFFDSFDGGALDNFSNTYFFFGPVLFSGTTANPTFVAGVYFVNSNGNTDTIAISDIGTTPLPAAFPLFATGLGVMGSLVWRRKRKAAVLTA